jgi:dynein intermediate chain, cytosolic
MQQRKDELVAKQAKLAELKRQRQLRAQQSSAGRASLGGAVDVRVQEVGGSYESLLLT